MFSQRGKVVGWKRSRVHISAEFPTGAALSVFKCLQRIESLGLVSVLQESGWYRGMI